MDVKDPFPPRLKERIHIISFKPTKIYPWAQYSINVSRYDWKSLKAPRRELCVSIWIDMKKHFLSGQCQRSTQMLHWRPLQIHIITVCYVFKKGNLNAWYLQDYEFLNLPTVPLTGYSFVMDRFGLQYEVKNVFTTLTRRLKWTWREIPSYVN